MFFRRPHLRHSVRFDVVATCSGVGIAQYQCNRVLRELGRSGLQPSEVDTFYATLSVPSSSGKLSRTFFADRVVSAADGHIRAFASETILAVKVLVLFLAIVVKPLGMLEQHIECFEYLAEIVSSLSSGDDILDHLQEVGEVSLRFPGVSARSLFYEPASSCVWFLRCRRLWREELTFP